MGGTYKSEIGSSASEHFLGPPGLSGSVGGASQTQEAPARGPEVNFCTLSNYIS